MARFFFTIAYDGTNFSGWQRQPRERSVTGCIEEALSILCRQEIALKGSGRTDAGVHAQAQIAHAELPYDSVTLPNDFHNRLNNLLPSDILIKKIELVGERMHARFSAKWREYQYFLTLGKSPFTSRFCASLPYFKLDMEAMQAAGQYLLGSHSFRSFSKQNLAEDHYLCRLTHIQWDLLPEGSFIGQSGEAFRCTLRANRFLRGQVRAMIGALIEVGKGKRAPEWIAQVLAQQSVEMPAALAPAEGLHLVEVGY